MQLIEELQAATAEAEELPIRALLLRAEGENFTAGAQVDDVFQGLTVEEAEQRLTGFQEMMQRSERLPFPTLAAVRGLCLAAGLETVLAVDLIWASETAMFAFAEPVIGLTPPAGGVFRLAARTGTGRAVESVLTGRPYPAETMERWGVVNRVLPDDELDEKTLRLPKKLAEGPTRAYAATKRDAAHVSQRRRRCGRGGDASDMRAAVRNGGSGTRDRVAARERPGSRHLQGALRAPTRVARS